MSEKSPKGEGYLSPKVNQAIGEMNEGFHKVMMSLHEGVDGGDLSARFRLAYEYLRMLEVLEKNALHVTDRLKEEALPLLKYHSGTVDLEIPGVKSPRRLRLTVPDHARRGEGMPALEHVSIALDSTEISTGVP